MQDTNWRYRCLGHAWLLLCLAFALHVTDEATTGFLSVYSPTVIALRERLGWWPMPTFEFGVWLFVLIVVWATLLSLSPLVYRGGTLARALSLVFAVIMLLNAGGHTLATIAGQTVASVTFARPAPGFWSSPLMAAAAIYLLVQVQRARTIEREHKEALAALAR